MISKIIEGIDEAQFLQDSEGGDNPGKVQVFSFPCPLVERVLLKIRRIRGLEFEYYNGQWYGIYRAHK